MKHARSHKLRNAFIIVLLLPVCVLLFLFTYIMSLDGWKEFDPSSVETMQESLRLYDAGGKEYLCLSNTEHRHYVSIDTLPDHVAQAFIAIEDARFYEHGGIDIVRIGGALIEDIRSGSFSEGASTISQQVVKNAALTFDKTVTRKLTEIMMAFKLEQAYSKEEIMEMYLNIVYFGNGAYGIQTAANTYFNKDACDLSIAEAATLAAIIKSPSAYSPTQNYENCLKRRNLVLEQMQKCGFITQNEFSRLVGQPIILNEGRGEFSYPYGYYTDTVLQEASDLLCVSITELMSGGYNIYTNLDADLQSELEKNAADQSAFPKNALGETSECAVIVMDSEGGEIRALIGGREHTARLSFNRASDMRRQPGSAIKPVLVFAPALEYSGYTTTSYIMDSPTSFGDYSPRNAGSSFRGWVTLRDTVAYSVNIPAVKLFEETGRQSCISYAKSVGIPFSSTDYNSSLALGGFTNGITPKELASAYQPFANGGSYTEAHTVNKITDRHGNVLFDSSTLKSRSVLSEESAFIMSSMLKSSVEYGTASRLHIDGIELCAKTGTTTYDDASNNKDAWIAAYNPDYIVCTWMGFDKTDAAHSLPQGVTGGTYPADFTAKIFKYLYKEKSAPVFAVPEGVCKVVIDNNALKNNYEAVLASTATPAEDRITEYYTLTTVPKSYANYLLPILPQNISAKEVENGVLISFDTQSNMVYTLKRAGLTLAVLEGNGLTAQFTDTALVGDKAVYTLTVSAKEGVMASGSRLYTTVTFKR